MLRFAIALLAVVVAAEPAESADRALPRQGWHHGWHRTAVDAAGGTAAAALRFPHDDFYGAPYSYRRPVPRLSVYEAPEQLYAPEYVELPYVRRWRAAGLLWIGLLLTNIRAPITAAPSSLLGPPALRLRRLRLLLAQGFRTAGSRSRQRQFLRRLFQPVPGQPLGLQDRERQHRDRNGLMRQREIHRNLIEQRQDSKRRLQRDQPASQSAPLTTAASARERSASSACRAASTNSA